MSRQIVPRRVSGVHGRAGAAVDDEITAVASALFDQYCAANTYAAITSTFQQMCDVLELKPSDHQNFYNSLKARLTTWKAQSLWAKLDKRAAQREYKKGRACANTRCLIIGGGPCGMRAAIEIALLGGKAVIVEKRDRFSRNNVLHLWPFLIHDLKALGAKKFFGKFCTGAVDHISIRTLQCILLKVALLLGVEIHHNVSFDDLCEPPEEQGNEKVGWRAVVTPRDHPISEYEFDVLVGADGKRNTLKGFKRKEFRGKLAIAITANFINRNTNAEARVEEISGVAFIFNQKFFKDLNVKTGIDLENIVYYKDETHYFVMTAKKHSLLQKGVLIHDYMDTARLLSQSNVNQQALLGYASEAADVSTRHQLPHLDYAHNHYGQPDVAMFDFTSIYAAEHACRVVERNGHKLLMGLCGDSLIEPFWPTGSGLARGFLGALDMAATVKNWASGRYTPLEVMSQRESVYQLLSQTTPENLNKNFTQYTIDPQTRYPNVNINHFKPVQVKHQYDCGDEQYLDEIVQIAEQKSKRYEWIRDSHYLQKWFSRQLESYRNLVKITDLSTSWRSGLALCALIHHYRPELIGDIHKLDPNEVANNNQLAFDVAEKELGIPPVMTGSDMAACDIPDKLTLVSYLSHFYEYFRKESIKPAKAKTPDQLPLPPRRVPQARSPAQRLTFLSRVSNRMRARKEEDQVERHQQQLSFTQGAMRKRVHADEDPDNVVLQGYTKFEGSVVNEPATKLTKAEAARLSAAPRNKNKVTQLARGLAHRLKGDPAPEKKKEPAKPQPTKPLLMGQAASGDVCYFCQKRVYVVERHSAEGVFFHRGCLKCDFCSTNLRIGQYGFQRADNGEAKFYCIQHIGLERPVRRSRKRSYDDKELRARLAAGIGDSDEDMDYGEPDVSEEPFDDMKDVPHTPDRVELIETSNGAVGGCLDKTPERIEYYTESEVEESEFEQTQHNLSASHIEVPGRASGSDSDDSSSEELEWSDGEIDEEGEGEWSQFAASYNKLNRLRKERRAARRAARIKRAAGSGSDTETPGSSDSWESESETEKESEGEESDEDRFRKVRRRIARGTDDGVRQDDGPPAVLPVEQPYWDEEEDDYEPRSPGVQLQSPLEYEDKKPSPGASAILKNRLSFFSAVSEPVRIDPFSFLGLSPAPNITKGDSSHEMEPEADSSEAAAEAEPEPEKADKESTEKDEKNQEEEEEETGSSSLSDTDTITEGSESEEDNTGVVKKVHHPIPTISIEEVDMVELGGSEEDEVGELPKDEDEEQTVPPEEEPSTSVPQQAETESVDKVPAGRPDEEAVVLPDTVPQDGVVPETVPQDGVVPDVLVPETVPQDGVVPETVPQDGVVPDTVPQDVVQELVQETPTKEVLQEASSEEVSVSRDDDALKKELDLMELEVELMKRSVGDRIAELAKVTDPEDEAAEAVEEPAMSVSAGETLTQEPSEHVMAPEQLDDVVVPSEGQAEKAPEDSQISAADKAQLDFTKAIDELQNVGVPQVSSPKEEEEVSMELSETDSSLVSTDTVQSEPKSGGSAKRPTDLPTDSSDISVKLKVALEKEADRQAKLSKLSVRRTSSSELESFENIEALLRHGSEDQATDMEADKLSSPIDDDTPEAEQVRSAPVAAMSSIAPSSDDLGPLSSVDPSEDDLAAKGMAPIASIQEMFAEMESPGEDLTPVLAEGTSVESWVSAVLSDPVPQGGAQGASVQPVPQEATHSADNSSSSQTMTNSNSETNDEALILKPVLSKSADILDTEAEEKSDSLKPIPNDIPVPSKGRKEDHLPTSVSADSLLPKNRPKARPLRKDISLPSDNRTLNLKEQMLLERKQQQEKKKKEAKLSVNHKEDSKTVTKSLKESESKLKRQLSAPEPQIVKLLEEKPKEEKKQVSKTKQPKFIKPPKIKQVEITQDVPLAVAAAAAARSRLTGRPITIDLKTKKQREEEVTKRLKEEHLKAKRLKEEAKRKEDEILKKLQEEAARKKKIEEAQKLKELEEMRKKKEEEARRKREERKRTTKPVQIEKLDSWKQADAIKRIDSLLDTMREHPQSKGDTLKNLQKRQSEEIGILAQKLMSVEYRPGSDSQGTPTKVPIVSEEKPSVIVSTELEVVPERPFSIDEKFITTRDKRKRIRNLSNQSDSSITTTTISTTPSGSVRSISSVSEMGSAPNSIGVSAADTGSLDLLATSESLGENISLDGLLDPDDKVELEETDSSILRPKSAGTVEELRKVIRPKSADPSFSSPLVVEISKGDDSTSMHTAESSLSESRSANTTADDSHYFTPNVSGVEVMDTSETSSSSKKAPVDTNSNTSSNKSCDSLDTERSNSPLSPGKATMAKRNFFGELPQPVRIDPKKIFSDLRSPQGKGKSLKDSLERSAKQEESKADKMKDWKSMDLGTSKKTGGLDLKKDWQSMDSSTTETLSPTAGVPKTNIVNGEAEANVFYTPTTSVKAKPVDETPKQKFKEPTAKKRILPVKEEVGKTKTSVSDSTKEKREAEREKARLDARRRARMLSDEELGIEEKTAAKKSIIRSDSQPESTMYSTKEPQPSVSRLPKPPAPQVQKVEGRGHDRVSSDSSSRSGGSQPSEPLMEPPRAAFSDGISDHSESSPGTSRKLIKEKTKSLDRDKMKRRTLDTPTLDEPKDKGSGKKEKRRSFLAMLLPKKDKSKDKNKSPGIKSPKEDKKGNKTPVDKKTPADKKPVVTLRTKLKTPKSAEKDRPEMNRSSTYADEFNPFFEDAYGMEVKEKLKLKEKLDQVAPPITQTPPEGRVAPRATVEEFDTESEFGDDRISVRSFQSQVSLHRMLTDEDKAKVVKKQQKAAVRRHREQELKRLRMAQEIQRQLEEVEIKQRQVEMKGIALERALRGEGPDASRNEADLMQEWFNVVHEKNMLVRYESELMVHARELELEDRHSRLEQQLRDRMSISETEMTPAQKEEEQRILEELLEVVEQRDSLVALLEEDRLREKAEDRDLKQMMSTKGFELSPVNYINRNHLPSLGRVGVQR